MRILSLLLLAGCTLLAQNERRNPLPVPDFGGYKTLKCDFHMHTVFSDGVVWPDTRMYEAWRDGLDCLAITDHDDYHPHKETVSVDLSNPHKIAAPVAEKLGLLLVPGFEITKGDLHVNALFVKDFNATAGKPLLPSLEIAKAQGAFLFWNHPGWKGRKDWYPEIDEAHKKGLIQGVEVINTGKLEEQTLPWIEEKKLTILSNTDVHQLVEYPAGMHRDSITLVFAKTRDLDGIREALDARRTIAWRNDEVWGASTLLGQLIEASISTRRAGNTVFVTNRSAIPLHLKFTPQQTLNEIFVIHPLSETRLDLRVKGEINVEFTNFHLTNGKNLTYSFSW
ncbi:MAG: hypothetical protein NW208_05270 [Bryobacter sp.]|nr:hypothetical protein [Bryobacter sp.]